MTLMEALLALDEAARLLPYSRRTLERRIAAVLLPVFRDGRRVAVLVVEVRRYVAAHRVPRGRAGKPPPAGGWWPGWTRRSDRADVDDAPTRAPVAELINAAGEPASRALRQTQFMLGSRP